MTKTCFKCGAEIATGMHGELIFSCVCYPTNAIKHAYTPCPHCGEPVFKPEFHRCHGIGAIPAESFTLAVPDGLQYCPACGVPMLQPDHTCHKVKPPTEAAMKQAMLVDRDTLKFEHVKRLALFMIEHEKTCEKCLFFAERGSKVRCAEYLNMDKVCSKWQKRVEVQK